MDGIVDAHHHFWDPATATYPWMTEAVAPLRRRFDADVLRPELARVGVRGTVVVQARHSLDETRELLETAEATDFVKGVVGWVDLTDPGIADVLAATLAGPNGRWLVGIRHQVHDEADPSWLMRRDVARGLDAVESAGLTFDLLVRPRELPATLGVVREHPALRFVLDHIGKPPIAAGVLEPWASLISSFGPLPNVTCKLSGLVTEADHATWRPDDLRPYVAKVVDTFGPDRLLFGSDWPVCLLAASYGQVVEALVACLDDLSAPERSAVMGANAVRTYGLADRWD